MGCRLRVYRLLKTLLASSRVSSVTSWSSGLAILLTPKLGQPASGWLRSLRPTLRAPAVQLPSLHQRPGLLIKDDAQ